MGCMPLEVLSCPRDQTVNNFLKCIVKNGTGVLLQLLIENWEGRKDGRNQVLLVVIVNFVHVFLIKGKMICSFVFVGVVSTDLHLQLDQAECQVKGYVLILS